MFVCEHGAAKSVIATAYFNKIAAERGLRARAVYRGVNPQTDLSVAALKGLRDDGLQVQERKPSPITQADVDAASVIFAIGCTLPSEKGVRCYACHDAHGTAQDALLRLPGNETCLQCHGPQLQAGPRGTPEAHSHHGATSAGNQCVACHMPQIATTIADVNVRSHTFNFISPSMTDKYGIPNPCTSCHKDKTTSWALDALNQWSNVSPWRMSAQ